MRAVRTQVNARLAVSALAVPSRYPSRMHSSVRCFLLDVRFDLFLGNWSLSFFLLFLALFLTLRFPLLSRIAPKIPLTHSRNGQGKLFPYIQPIIM